jgi:dTDP-glucose pyrophosphorylase
MNNRIDKVVVLAAGLGTRMRKQDESAALNVRQSAVAQTGVKALIPMRTDRPFLDYVLYEAAEAGFRRACLVIGPDHDALRDSYGPSLGASRLSISFAVQNQPLGTADAVAAAERFADGDEFLMLNADNLYPTSACRALRELDGPGVALFERDATLRGSNIPPQRLRNFAVGLIGDDCCLRRIIEKPDQAALDSLGDNVYLGLNCWRFGPAIFQACRKIGKSPRG